MNAYTTLTIMVENNEQTSLAVTMIKRIVEARIPEYDTELETFISDIHTNDNTISVNASCSLTCNTFCEMIPQIMIVLARHGFGKHEMTAAFTSKDRVYHVTCTGRRFQNGRIRISLLE